MQADVPRLGPRSVTDIVDATFSLYRRNFALFAGVVAVLAIPETLMKMAITAAIPVPTPSNSADTLRDVANTVGPAYAASSLQSIIGFIFGLLILGALSLAISRRFLGQPVSVLDAYTDVGVGQFIILLGTIVLSFLAALAYLLVLIVMVAVLALISPPLAIGLGILAGMGSVVLFIYVGVRLVFVVPAVVIERQGVRGAFRRTWQLSGGYWWRILGLTLLVGLIVGIVGGLLNAFAAALSLGHPVIGTGLSGVLNVLIQPIQYCALTLLYYDHRIRKEGFDLEYAAQSAHIEPEPWAPPASS